MKWIIIFPKLFWLMYFVGPLLELGWTSKHRISNMLNIGRTCSQNLRSNKHVGGLNTKHIGSLVWLFEVRTFLGVRGVRSLVWGQEMMFGKVRCLISMFSQQFQTFITYKPSYKLLIGAIQKKFLFKFKISQKIVYIQCLISNSEGMFEKFDVRSYWCSRQK